MAISEKKKDAGRQVRNAIVENCAKAEEIAAALIVCGLSVDKLRQIASEIRHVVKLNEEKALPPLPPSVTYEEDPNTGALRQIAGPRPPSPFPFKSAAGRIVDEKCRCGALRSDHCDTLAFGHGAAPQTNCGRFTFVSYVFG